MMSLSRFMDVISATVVAMRASAESRVMLISTSAIVGGAVVIL